MEKLTVEQMKKLKEVYANAKDECQKNIDAIDAEMVHRFNIDTDHTGTRSFKQVKFNVPKNISWDQDELKSASDIVISWGEPVDDYIETTMKVSETKYKNWPKTIQEVFEGARIVKPGKVKVEFI